jgi:hypothetical protein
MKFLVFAMFDAAKAAEMAQANDKLAKTPGRKVLSTYTCMGLAFPSVPPNKLVTISVVEYESSEAMAAVLYPLEIAGATVWAVPVLEMPVAGHAEAEKKYRK